MSKTFMDAVLSGEALWVDADDWVAEWHEHETGVELHEFLGMAFGDYALWTERPETLRSIIGAYEADEPIADYLREANELAIAARGLTEQDRRAILVWLRRTGRLPPA
jgi:hypothetical protein